MRSEKPIKAHGAGFGDPQVAFNPTADFAERIGFSLAESQLAPF